jgi:hypothetical protein
MASIYLIRHAEKPEPGQQGVSAAGEPDAQGLTVRGWQRAGALVGLFAMADNGPRHALLARPRHLYAAVDAGRSHRPADTLLPLAECLRMPVQPLASNGDPLVAAQALWSCGEDVLVCWRRRELPPLARALLPAIDGLPVEWDKDCFDVVWVIQPASLTVVPQRLLAGDRGRTACSPH